jgi:hypothetical protein
MKKHIIPILLMSSVLIAISALACKNMVRSLNPFSVDGKNQCEGILTRVDKGEIQLAVTVTPESASDLPDVLSTEEVVKWLAEGKLKPENKLPHKLPWQPSWNCHIIYENHNGVWFWVCVSGSGSGTRCPCGNVDIGAPVMN